VRPSKTCTVSADNNNEDDWAITPYPIPLGAVHEPPAREDPPAPILTVDELAVLLRVNRKTLYDALARGEIPGARRIGGRYRVLRDAVLEWFASGQDRVPRSRRNR
jgi:excisionase family DNA binding protein